MGCLLKKMCKKKMSAIISIFFITMMVMTNQALGLSNSTKIEELKVEYNANPIGIDIEKPRFSWKIESDKRGEKQTAYQILVASSKENLTTTAADIWNTGRILSDESVAVEYAGKKLEASTRYYWKVIVWDDSNNKSESTGEDFFETGLMSNDGVTGWDGAKWISMDNKEPNSLGAPMFRKEEKLSGTVKSAKLYISSLGVYDAYINDKKLGTVNQDGDTDYDFLSPGWTNYNKTINYMTYDVTSYIKNEDSATLAVTLGNGWYNGRISTGSKYYSTSGNDLALLAKLVIIYENDEKQTIVTDTQSGWKSTDKGPVLGNDIYDGETYDATKEISGWKKGGFDDSNWSGVKENSFAKNFPDAKVIAYNGKKTQIVDKLSQSPKSITLYNEVINKDTSKNGKGEVEIDNSRTITDEKKAKTSPITIKYGDTAIYDFGQNMVGIPSFKLKGDPGTKIMLHFGEILNDDSAGADGPKGSVYFANLRTAKQTSLYTLKGSEEGEIHQDELTYYGFRYIEVTVLTPGASVEITNMDGKVVTSAIDQTGTIETSNNDINKLFSNIVWGQRGNYLWVPTDCPQRDERLGWTGDAQLFSNTALYNTDSSIFLENYMKTLVDSQETYGLDGAAFTAVAPGAKYANFQSFSIKGKGPKGQSGWADAGVIIPWTVWQMTGDTTVIKKNYEAMVKYMQWIYSETGESYAGPGSIGDWLAFQGTSNQLMSHIYYAYDAKLMAQMSKAINNDSESDKYNNLFEKIKQAFIDKYIVSDKDGNITIKSSLIAPSYDLFEIKNLGGPKEDNSQAALLWALKLGLYKDDSQKQQIINLLTENIKNSDKYKEANPTSSRVNYGENTLSVGFLGINVIAPVLSDIGQSDISYDLLFQDKMPSWLYSVKNGATTIWERWNSYSSEKGFGDVSMNSFNHYSYGAIGEWMYKYMAGIANDPTKPGFKHIILNPVIDKDKRISYVNGSYNSVYGTIISDWQVKDNDFIYKVKVPANTTATVYIPTSSEDTVKEGGQSISKVNGIKFVEYKDGKAVYEIESGDYEFSSTITSSN